MEIKNILKKYYGYDAFRPLQEDIIHSILQKKDTLALLPTGGGKSICFQIPALAQEGLCIVVSPLIALMKDQVENLRKRGIKAIYIVSGMKFSEIDKALDNCVYGDVKFLYVSPERLKTEIFKERIKRMKVNLIAVDEAHCISQWGYDFRPSYLQIAGLRELLPGIPVMALTATATKEVRQDIMDQLQFKEKNIFQKSFERKNINYLVLYEENKMRKLVEICTKIKGTGVVYVRNRKLCKEISDYLNRNGVQSDYYHAGLDALTRTKKQDNWIKDKSRVIVATNAFGMGIDKPDVRFVVHIDLPDSLEAYYQEAGRGGRDEQKAYALLLMGPNDDKDLIKKNLEQFPNAEEVETIYHAIANYFNQARGSGIGDDFDFDLLDLCQKFSLNPLKVLHALKFLENDKVLQVSEEVFLPSRIMFKVDSGILYKFQVDNTSFDEFLKVVLRSYGGLFEGLVKVNEKEIARRLNTTEQKIVDSLSYLEQCGIIDYIPMKNKPQLQFLMGRLSTLKGVLDKQFIKIRQTTLEKKIHAVVRYATNRSTCRSKMILNYFDENIQSNCGQCDYCLELHSDNLSDKNFTLIKEKVLGLNANNSLTLEYVLSEVKGFRKSDVIEALRILNEEGSISLKR